MHFILEMMTPQLRLHWRMSHQGFGLPLPKKYNNYQENHHVPLTVITHSLPGHLHTDNKITTCKSIPSE